MPSWIKFFFNKFATLTGSWPFATVTKPRVPDSMPNDFFRSPLAPISPPPPNNDPLITPRTLTVLDTNPLFPPATSNILSPGFGRSLPPPHAFPADVDQTP